MKNIINSKMTFEEENNKIWKNELTFVKYPQWRYENKIGPLKQNFNTIWNL